MKQVFFYLLTLIMILFLNSCDSSETLKTVDKGCVENCKENEVCNTGNGLCEMKISESKGWTEFTASEDTRIIYISENGNDETAKYYSKSDTEIGDNPFKPSGNILSFKTYEEARKQARMGFPDWILLKRGDRFKARIIPLGGRGVNEYALVSAYGESGSMPMVTPIDSNTAVLYAYSRRAEKLLTYSAVTSIDFYANTRDPEGEDFIDKSGVGGISMMALGANDDEKGLIEYFLIEGCKFRFFNGNVIQPYDQGTVKNITIRRNVFLDNYSDGGGHCQGLYINKVDGIILEENIFDHNGWYNQAPSDLGEATMFNHNTYFPENHNVVFRKNIFMRGSSMNNKFTANDGAASSSNITLENNLYIDGEIGIGIGGNKEDPFRFKNITIKNNVFTEIGRSQATNRTLGWAIDTTDWDGGTVENNLIIHNTNPNVTNTYGINIQGALKNVTMKNNISYNINGYGLVVQDRNANLRENIKISDNIFQESIFEKTILSVSDLTGFTFNNNKYFTQVREDRQVRILGEYSVFDLWKTNYESTALFSEYTFPDVSRSIETYNTSISEIATIDAFIESCRNQGRFNWDERYTAPVVNDWLRDGFVQ